MTSMSPRLHAAWRDYQAGVERVRETLFSQDWAKGAEAQARGFQLFHSLQAMVYNLIVAPRQDYPRFYLHTANEPLLYNKPLISADSKVRKALLDGNRTYRIWGKRNSSLFVDFQVNRHFYVGGDPRIVSSNDLDKFDIKSDGTFEIIASATPHPGNWIKLDPETGDQNYLLVREFFYDWGAEVGADLHIERIDNCPARPTFPTEDEIVARLGRAEDFLRFNIAHWSIKLTETILREVGHNTLFLESYKKDKGGLANPEAAYPTVMWKLEPDEALIIESEVPKCAYWNVQIGDIWWQNVDYIYHQSSLNGHQAAVDDDGIFRAVVCPSDPGILNWLDPDGSTQGILIFRYFRIERAVLPQVRFVQRTDLDAEFAKSRRVTPQKRVRHLEQRRTAGLARFGY